MIALLRLGLVLAFLFLFVCQRFLLVGVFLKQLLRLLLMLLFDKLFFGGIGRLLREFRVFLLLLLLNSLPVLLLLHAELILLLLVLSVQLGIRGGRNDEPRWSRNLVRMNCRRRTRAIGLLLGSILPRFLGNSLELRRLLPGLVVSGPLRSFLLNSLCGGLLLRCLLPGFVVSGPLRGVLLGLVYGSLLLRCLLLGLFGRCLLLRGFLLGFFRG
jgi:hypothetical protein